MSMKLATLREKKNKIKPKPRERSDFSWDYKHILEKKKEINTFFLKVATYRMYTLFYLIFEWNIIPPLVS